MIDLSVAIVSFNTRDLLLRTIEAVLQDTTTLATEVLIVDNASRDGSAGAVRQRFAGLTVIENAENRFYTAANNQAIAASRGRYILILNSDATPTPGTLPAMAAYLDRHPRVGVLSPRLYGPDGRLQRNCARFRTFASFVLEYTVVGAVLGAARRRARADLWYGDWDRSTSRAVDVVPGSCMLVRRDVIDRVGGFDDDLRLYFGEDDWCLRIRAAGFEVAYVALGGIIHEEGASTTGVRRLARRLYFEDMIRYVRKHFGPWRARLLRALIAPTAWAIGAKAALRRS